MEIPTICAKLERILIVEGDPVVASLLEETLKELGHHITAIASNGDDAIAKVRACQPDFMIVDVGLGESNGVSAAIMILAQRSAPYLFVTDDARRVRAAFPEAVILEKPFFVPALVAAIALARTQTRQL